MGEDGERVRRVAQAIWEQALFEAWRVPPAPEAVARHLPRYLAQARVALLAADGNARALAEERRARTAWGALLLGEEA